MTPNGRGRDLTREIGFKYNSEKRIGLYVIGCVCVCEFGGGELGGFEVRK